MLNGLALTHIITLYYTVRTMHGIYVNLINFCHG